MNKVSRAALAGIIGAVAAGCTAVLGSFEVSSSAIDDTLDANEDATGVVDVQPGDGDGGVEDAAIDDASLDAPVDAGDGLLSCTSVRKEPVLMVAPSDGTTLDGRILSVFRAGDVVRIAALKRVGKQEDLVLYTFDPKRLGGPASDGRPKVIGTDDREGRVLDVQHAGDRISVLGAVIESSGTQESVVFVVWESPDDRPDQALIEKPLWKTTVPVSTAAGVLGTYDGPDQYVYALSVQDGPSRGDRAVYYGRWKEGADREQEKVVKGDDDVPAFRVSSLARSGKSVFIFNGALPGVNDQGATGYIRVPEDPAPADLQFKSIAGAETRSSYRLVAANGLGAVGGMRIAAIESEPSDAGSSSVFLRAGALGPNDLPTIDVSKLPRAIAFSSLSDVPLDGAQGRFFGNDLVIVGAPPLAAPDKGGLNFVWYDLLSRKPRAMVTGDGRFLKDVQVIAASAALTKRLPNDASVDLVWIEEQTNPPVRRLMYDELRCR